MGIDCAAGCEKDGGWGRGFGGKRDRVSEFGSMGVAGVGIAINVSVG